ncbi:MAG: squalene synthase HpnC [Chloroflexota bacterium]
MLTEHASPASSVLDAYAQCRRIALGHYENFPLVSWLLPRDLAPHIFALYAYCRGVDDLGDESEGDWLALLDQWETELDQAFAGRPGDARFIALADTIRRFKLPRDQFERLIEASRRDQCVTRYQTFDDLLDYCTYSANPVGRLVLRIFGCDDAELDHLSDATCTALQLANMWQDVARDFAIGRVYIPLEDMARFGVTEADLGASTASRDVRRLVRCEVRRTREYFAHGLPLIERVGGRFRLDLRMFTLGGLAVLDAIKKQRYDVLAERPRVSGATKAWLAVRGLAPVRMSATR